MVDLVWLFEDYNACGIDSELEFDLPFVSDLSYGVVWLRAGAPFVKVKIYTTC